MAYWIRKASLKAGLQAVLLPHEYHPTVESIDMQILYRKGYRSALVDLDNTLLPYGKYTLSLRKTAWVQTVITLGFSVAIISNNKSHERVELACEQLGVRGLHFACKPSVGAFFAFNEQTGPYNRPIVIGDQLFTDGIFGNRIGAYTIIVDPIDPAVSLRKIIQREIERGIMTVLA